MNFCYLLEDSSNHVYFDAPFLQKNSGNPVIPLGNILRPYCTIEQIWSLWEYHPASVLLFRLFEIWNSKVRFPTLLTVLTSRNKAFVHPVRSVSYFYIRNLVRWFCRCCCATPCILQTLWKIFLADLKIFFVIFFVLSHRYSLLIYRIHDYTHFHTIFNRSHFRNCRIC